MSRVTLLTLHKFLRSSLKHHLATSCACFGAEVNNPIGALDNRTNDSGIISGNLEFAKNGQAKFYNLARSCSVAIGDYVVTSGEGIFPKGLLIGKIETIGNDKYNTSIYATVTPFANIDELRQVMVITDFDGQGNVLQKIGE